MKIAIDFDGTIANTNLLKQHYALSHFGIQIPSFLCDRTSFSEKYGFELYEEVASAIYTKTSPLLTPPVPGAIQAIHELAKQHKLILVSSRSEDTLKWAKEWLYARGIGDLFLSIHSSNKIPKIDICEFQKCNILIDDDLRHLKGIGDDYTYILFKHQQPKTLKYLQSNLLFANSWKSIVKIIYTL